ncbi:site-specific DNA-methyltransferase [Pseudomonas aeruginosa]|uniref:site-specific DNA-methyltransferase n=1 Tax=Pseudomonas aeruginosa TaxID=287 RepID=UPI00068EC942|nr:DNA methyltransferase [Pseudomonas aeruginosa]MBV5580700.1 site-specific DNA-methyltransferase [Pseudomonas aeruginosa]HBP1729214.1 site-specific DNA-methyltransferase [Pseudomonas aeruginosa]HCF2599562.1 site-specific DNA-methyltransferase [Pseudomonas aeruginosa]HEJ9826931.1 site-specific DNA-methyltransferase [Pseudomonas aeruginosa]
MSAIHDLIAQVSDPRLRERLTAEWANASKDKKFGLVFEDHLPELLPLFRASPRKGDLVCRRAGGLKDVWQVKQVRDGQAICVKPSNDEHPSESTRAAAEPVQFLVDELLVVREFGEPIFPALVPIDAVANGPADAPWHTLIEADNYHALQLLDYLYAGQVDCIYIDPPYNTGARDWKYNNDYVDGNDGWRHSKWLAFMEKRLRLAKRLLKPNTGVLIVTIDEHEVHHLGMLLEQEFPEAYRQLVTIVINPKGVTQGRFSRVEEYALFCFGKQAFVNSLGDDLLSPILPNASVVPRWKGLLRSGTNARRQDRHKMFFPVLIDKERHAIVGAGDFLPLDKTPDLDAEIDGYAAAWPIRMDGSFGNWGVGPETLRALIKKGYVSLGGFDPTRKTWGISYLSRKLQLQIESGAIRIVEFDKTRNVVCVEYAEERDRQVKTLWHRSTHDAGAYGADLLKAILGEGRKFSFPKSLYATRDAVAACVRDRPNALVVDFFAGSGTTLNAVNLLNAVDGGQRRCILVTNNEVSAEESASLSARGLQPGDAEWEAQGICRSVTWPRSKFTILGQRDNGSVLEGEYLTGRTVGREKARSFTQIGFVDPAQLDTPAKKKQVVALIDGLPQTLVKDPCLFIVSEDHKASVLFDPSAAEDWLDALDGQEHITDFYIVTPIKKVFEGLKAQVVELLGPLLMPEIETRPMSLGFVANLAYFKLDFLERECVSLRRAFREILPLLWLKAGAVGPRPELKRGDPEPALFAPDGSNFVVLLDETRMGRLLKELEGRNGLAQVFIVTDADESFKTMAQDVREVADKANPGLQVVQLYRDYLLNFMINKNQDRVATAAITVTGTQGARV